MAEQDASDSDGPAIGGNMVLVVSSDGSVCSVLEAPCSPDGDPVPEAALASLDTIWPAEIAHQMRANVDRVIRSRQCHRDEIESPADGKNYELIFVAQGRDRALLIARDLGAHSVKLSRIRELAYKDKVTELPNREYLLGEFQKIAQMQKLKEGRAAMICIHVDQFDDHGHALSSVQQDEIMKELAQRLTRQLRGSNEPTDQDLERLSIVARTDFRQFGVVLPSIEGGEDAEAVTERLILTLMRPISVGARTIGATAQAGIALFPQDGDDAATLFDNAAAALEDARNNPSSPYKLHSGTVRLRALQRQDLEVELRTALDQEDYSLRFLPIVSADDHRPVTVEALLRWPETILGTHSTRKIVSIAERTGLILPIGEWVLKSCCEQLKRCHEAGHSNLRVAINLSAQEFSRSDLAARIRRILDATSLSPELFDFEIREHMLFRDAISGFASATALRNLGVRVVVDDFGTGACSLAYLSQSPVDAIKIDHSIVANVESNEQDMAASAAAIAVADKLGLDVVAEGVETEAQAEILRSLGCGYLQGFLFGEPLTDDDLIGWLDEASDEQLGVEGLR